MTWFDNHHNAAIFGSVWEQHGFQFVQFEHNCNSLWFEVFSQCNSRKIKPCVINRFNILLNNQCQSIITLSPNCCTYRVLFNLISPSHWTYYIHFTPDNLLLYQFWKLVCFPLQTRNYSELYRFPGHDMYTTLQYFYTDHDSFLSFKNNNCSTQRFAE